jgi:proton-translocating NADH-quinone oxidoreductase chain N
LWPTTAMEILFSGAIISLLAEMGGSRSEFLRSRGSGLAVVSAALLSLVALASGWGGSLGPMVQLQPAPSSFASLYTVDRYSTFAAFTVLVVGLAVALHSLTHFDGESRGGPFYPLLSLLLCCLVGVVSAGDYLTLFLFWEGMSVCAYGLVGFSRSKLSSEASIKYFLLTGLGSLLALYGIATIYAATGSIQLQAAAAALASGSGYGELGLALLLVGLGVEAAVVPMHTWLPDVYGATELPVASVVSGAVTGTGVFALLRVVQPLVPGGGFGALAMAAAPGTEHLQLLLASLALLTMLLGNLSALAQRNLRRLLSFSSVAQTGYMLAALSTLSVAGLVAVVFTIWNHGILKSNFFMIIGKENSAYEAAELDSLRGTGRRDRTLGFLYASSSLAMVGSPPFGLFWSEILVVQSLLLASSPLFFWLALAVVLNVVLSIGYYFRVVNTVVFGDSPAPSALRPRRELLSPTLMLSASLLTGLAPFLILGHVL